MVAVMTLHDAPSAHPSPDPTTSDLPGTSPRLVDPPARRVVMIDGAGSPDSPRFGSAVGKLYAASGAGDVPLEALWSQAGRAGFDLSSDKNQWLWTLLVPIRPDTDVSRLPEGVRAEVFAEGKAAEILHIGSYDDEEPTVATLLMFITRDCGLAVGGAHHEIYLDDPRSCPSDQLRTIIRLPVR